MALDDPVAVTPLIHEGGTSPGPRLPKLVQVVAAGPQPAPSPSLPHILLLLDQFPRSLGGGERIALRMASLLPAYGFRVSILTFSVHPESAVLTTPAPCPVYLLPLERTYDLQALRSALALGQFLRTQQVRLVQTFFESSDLWGGLVVKTLSRARLVWSRRDMGILRQRKHRVAYRWLRALPDAVFAVSERVREYTIAVDGVAPGRVQTIYNGLDVPAAAPEPTRPAAERRAAGAARIVSLGNIRPVKGFDVLLRAARTVLDRLPQTTFEIAGEVLEPEHFAELGALAASLGLVDSVRFVGGVQDTAAFLIGADLFVLPSRSEGFSNAIVEAMAASLPVVATDVGGNAEAVATGVTGLIVPAGDPEALAAAMLALLLDPERLAANARAGRQRVLEHFSTGAMMGRIVSFYRGAL